MPARKSASQVTAAKKSEHARKLLQGVVREDSDDELGDEDIPWEWVYEDNSSEGAQDVLSTPSKKRKNQATKSPCSRIIGAKMGDRFECRIGDCLLIKGEGLTGEAYVGLACEFMDNEDGEKECNVMWFSTEFEVKSKNKRTDYLPNELYINPSWNQIPLTSINGRAIVLSQQQYQARYPDGVPKKSKEYGKVFICRRGCAPRTATYTEEFIWEDIYKGRDTDIDMIVQRIMNETRAIRKPRRAAPKIQSYREDSDASIGDASDYDDLDDAKTPRTPRKRQKLSITGTQSGRTPSSKLTTPTHKRVVIKKALEFTPLGTRILPSNIFDSPYALARNRLHVSAIPASLPCREAEFTEVYTHLEDAISEGTGSCIYISGTPGTGKTATVREVIAQLQAAVATEELEDFIFVEINGMKIADPHQSYSLLWEAIKGERVTPSHALTLLEAEFSTPSPRRVPCVVLMDELDQLVTKNQSVMYNFFNWPGVRHSKLIVLAVANTMDLPERTLSNKISSRLGLTRITFPGYTHDQLMKIIQSRLEGVPGNIVDPDAIQFASRKVAAVSGDARRALDICRRAVEIVEYALGKNITSAPCTPRHRGANGIQASPSKNRTGAIAAAAGGRVTIAVIKQAINEATGSPLQQYLRHLPLSAKLFLASVLARIRRSGVGENVMADVIDEAERMAKMSGDPEMEEIILAACFAPSGGGGRAGVGGGMGKTGARVAGLMSAAAMLMEAGLVVLELKRGERAGRVRLNVAEDEVMAALRDDKEVGGMIGR